MKKSVLFLLLLGLTLYCWSQQVSNRPEGYAAVENFRALAGAGARTAVGFDDRYEGVTGTPYAFADWFPGDVFFNTKERYHFNALNYNTVNKKLLFKDPDTEQPTYLNKYIVDFFTIYRYDTLVFVPLTLPGESDLSFVRVIYEGNSSAYWQYDKEFIKADYKGGYSADRRYDEYIDRPNIYLRLNEGGELLKVRKSKKALAELFSGREKEMSAYIKENKTDLQNPADIKKMMMYFDLLN